MAPERLDVLYLGMVLAVESDAHELAMGSRLWLKAFERSIMHMKHRDSWHSDCLIETAAPVPCVGTFPETERCVGLGCVGLDGSARTS